MISKVVLRGGVSLCTWAAFSLIAPDRCHGQSNSIADQLTSIRENVISLEQDLLTGAHLRQATRKQVQKIRKLMDLQRREQELGQKRLKELENTVGDLEKRKGILSEKLRSQQSSIRQFLMAIESSSQEDLGAKLRSLQLSEGERIEAPRRQVLANLASRGLKEVQALHGDLADQTQLSTRIQSEKQQLVYLIQDLSEQKNILDLSNQVRLDYLKKKKNEHLIQLENYRKLKSAEVQLEGLIRDFSARRELEKIGPEAQEGVSVSAFFRLKGKLPYPVHGGKVVGGFGRAFDPVSGLYIFRKGVDIHTNEVQLVRAILPGKVAFAGEMPHYGRVVIIDHGGHFYSLCAHLGVVSKNAGDEVALEDPIGLTGDRKTPLYFEIRTRNVAVNPLQWLIN